MAAPAAAGETEGAAAVADVAAVVPAMAVVSSKVSWSVVVIAVEEAKVDDV